MSTAPEPVAQVYTLLAAGWPVLTAVQEQLADGSRFASFLCPVGRKPNGRHLRVTSLACPAPPLHLVAAVVLSRPGKPAA